MNIRIQPTYIPDCILTENEDILHRQFNIYFISLRRYTYLAKSVLLCFFMILPGYLRILIKKIWNEMVRNGIIRKVQLIGVGLLFCVFLSAAEWQWMVPLRDCISKETKLPQEAFLWIPPSCERVKAVVVGQQNMSEETLFHSPVFREAMAQLGMALVWIAPELDQRWDVSKGVQQAFDAMLADLAEVSGYSELTSIPIVPVGHSAQATFPWNFAAWNPERTLAIISLHGDAPRTNLTGYGGDNLEWGRTRNIDGIPGLMIEGEYEWWEARVNPALAFRMMYPASCVSFLCDTGRGHFDVADETIEYIALFIKKAWLHRWNEALGRLEPVDVRKGWLAARWNPIEGKRPVHAPYTVYEGDPHDAFWYFDKDMAERTEARYRKHQGKRMQYIGIRQGGKLMAYNEKAHVRLSLPFLPEADGVTFHLQACFTDSTHNVVTEKHGRGEIRVDCVCGPVKKVNDTTFVLDFNRIGMNNPRRSGSITLVASHSGDNMYKGVVQELMINIPLRLTEGENQRILFPVLDDVRSSTEHIFLQAETDSGLPVSYYVKEGPAEVEGNELRFTSLPSRTKFPVKVTVVAWQYGLKGKVQTAEPVERSFCIYP